jgi:tRNA threonylcarbamoyladenosine biosynthesis protein TsaB
MALILSLDATTTVCSVALHRNGDLLASEFISELRAASSRLMMATQELLKNSGLNAADLDAVAVSSGPGSYTGLRIATSAAKGICVALNIPLLAVNSLKVMAWPIIQQGIADLYCPMIDARRMEVYCCLFDGAGAEISPIEAKILDVESFKNYLNQSKIAFFGDGSQKFKVITNHPNALFVEDIHPHARHLGTLAAQKFANGQFEDVETFEPYYLKDFLIKSKQSDEQG